VTLTGRFLKESHDQDVKTTSEIYILEKKTADYAQKCQRIVTKKDTKL